MNTNTYNSLSQREINFNGVTLTTADASYIKLPNLIRFIPNDVFYFEAEVVIKTDGNIGGLFIGGSTLFYSVFFRFNMQGAIKLFQFNNGVTNSNAINDFALTNINLLNRYVKYRMEGDGTNVKVFINGLLIYTGDYSVGTGFNSVFELKTIGARTWEVDNLSTADYPYNSNAYTSQCLINYIDINGDLYDFQEGSGNTLTSSQGNVATIHHINPDPNYLNNEIWQKELITLRNIVI